VRHLADHLLIPLLSATQAVELTAAE